MGGKSSSAITGYHYLMGVHMGISRGPVNALVEIKVGDKTAWPKGNTVETSPGVFVTTDAEGPVLASGSRTISAPTLFGGEDKEGGIEGGFDVMMGEPTQAINSRVLSMVGGGLISAFRGMLTLFYDGLIASNNPYPKPWKFRLRRTTAGWQDDDPFYPAKATIQLFRTAEAPVPITPSLETVVKMATGIISGDNLVFTAQGTVLSILEVVVTLGSDNGFESIAGGSFSQLGSTVTITGLSAWSGYYVQWVTYETEVLVTTEDPPNVGLSEERRRIDAMNPAHIIYECLTNEEWGLGIPSTLIDEDTFTDVADVLYAENFGLCILWTREDTIDAFIQTVVNHIAAVIDTSRQTGKIYLKLIRDDYDINTIPEYTTSDGVIELQEDDETTLTSLLNEFIVSWKDPVADKERQSRVQNLALFQATGRMFSKSQDYPGIPTEELALRVAQRDLRIHCTPLRRIRFKMNRKASQLNPGDVFKYSDTIRGITDMVMRVGEVVDGADVTITAVQDVFGLPSASFIGTQQVLPPEDTGPAQADYEALFEAGYIDFLRELSPGDFAALTESETYFKLYGARPNSYAINFNTYTGLLPSGPFSDKGVGNWSPAGLTPAMTHTTTSMTLTSLYEQFDFVVGRSARIDDEIVRIDSYNPLTGAITVARGCADSIPAAHVLNSVLWFYEDTGGADPTAYTEGEQVRGKVLTSTSEGDLHHSLADPLDYTLVGRHPRPYPPAQVEVDGVPFYSVDPITPKDPDGPIVVSWVDRNRITQGDVLIDHFAAGVTPEAGVTYTIRALDPGTLTMIDEAVGITGTSWNYNLSTPGVSNIILEIVAVRDTWESWQPYRIPMSVLGNGWGSAWGYNWGSPS